MAEEREQGAREKAGAKPEELRAQEDGEDAGGGVEEALGDGGGQARIAEEGGVGGEEVGVSGAEEKGPGGEAGAVGDGLGGLGVEAGVEERRLEGGNAAAVEEEGEPERGRDGED